MKQGQCNCSEIVTHLHWVGQLFEEILLRYIVESLLPKLKADLKLTILKCLSIQENNLLLPCKVCCRDLIIGMHSINMQTFSKCC